MNDLAGAEQQLALFERSGQYGDLLARLQKALAASRASADAAAKVASRLKEFDFDGALAASGELGITGVRRCLLSARLAAIAGRFEEAEGLLTNCTASPGAERRLVEKEQEQLATTRSESLKLRKQLDEFLYSGIAVSNWLYCYPELKDRYRVSDYVGAVQAAATLTPVDGDVLRHALCATMMTGDYASFKHAFDAIAKGSPVVRIPALDGKAHSELVIDTERREFRYERLERSFDVQFNEKSQPLNIGRPVGCGPSHSGGLHYNRAVKPSEPWTLTWDQVRQISNHSAIITGRSFALRLNESNFVPALKVVYTDMDPWPIGLMARNAWAKPRPTGGRSLRRKNREDGASAATELETWSDHVKVDRLCRRGGDRNFDRSSPSAGRCSDVHQDLYDDFSRSTWQLSIDELLAGVTEEIALLP